MHSGPESAGPSGVCHQRDNPGCVWHETISSRHLSSMPRLTLTFDNGPWLGATEAVLDILAERSVRATFFVVGERLKALGGRALAERARAAGHWIEIGRAHV